VEDGQDPAACASRAGEAEHERDRGGEGQERRGDHREEEVLDHVDGEERRVVALDAGQERKSDREQPEPEGHRPGSRHGVRGVDGVHPSDRPAPPECRREDPERRERRERPAEKERGDGRRVVRDGAVRRDRMRDHQPGRGGRRRGEIAETLDSSTGRVHRPAIVARSGPSVARPREHSALRVSFASVWPWRPATTMPPRRRTSSGCPLSGPSSRTPDVTYPQGTLHVHGGLHASRHRTPDRRASRSDRCGRRPGPGHPGRGRQLLSRRPR
jgi:hypothetical protein